MAHKDQDYSDTQAFLADQNYDQDEVAILHLSRLYFLAHTDPMKPHWDAAMDFSELMFGPEYGPLIAYCVTEVLQNMRESRKTTFRFTNPCCAKCAARLTNNERLLTSTISAFRKGDSLRAKMNALILCEGFDSGPMLKAIGRLTKTLDQVRV